MIREAASTATSCPEGVGLRPPPIVLTALQILAFVAVTLPLSLLATITGQFGFMHGAFYGIGHLWGRTSLRLGRVQLTVRGLEHIEGERPYLVVANHASYFDVFAVLAALPGRLSFLVKRELTWIPIWGWGLIRSPFVIVDRKSRRDARKGLRAAERCMREGDRRLVFFPEGTRTSDGTLLPFRRGAFIVAARTGAPLLPVTINGSRAVLPKGRFRARPGHIEVVIGEPIEIGSRSDRVLCEMARQAISAGRVP